MKDDLSALIEGFRSFKHKYSDTDQSVFKALVELGQQPTILVFACCDSRVDPAIITESKAGDMLVVRNLANIVPPYTDGQEYQAIKAAIEYAISFLHVEHVIVMGHSRCGGIRTLVNRLIDGDSPGHPMQQWTAIAEPAAIAALKANPGADRDTITCDCSRRTVGISLKNLAEYPWIADALERGKLQLHGWYFDLNKFALQERDPATGEFHNLC